MTERLLLALAQLNPVVGDIAGNLVRLTEVWRDAARQGAQLVIAPELCVTGYALEDLALKSSLLDAVQSGVMALARDTACGPALLIGAPWREGGNLYNASLLLDGGAVVAQVFKRNPPNYSSFDEKRVFAAGPLPEPVAWRGYRLGIMVCEDMWSPEVAAHLRQRGAHLLVVPNGSPFESGKHDVRRNIAVCRAQETGLPLVYVNQIGGQDELVFDGASFIMDAAGEITAQAKAWAEDLVLTSWVCRENVGGGEGAPKFDSVAPEVSVIAPIPDGEAAVYQALMLGVRDYVNKNGFRNTLLGLSGGIDSALVAAVAVDALGADRLRAVMMPSPYTSQDSLDDAAAVAKALGCRLDTLSIAAAMQAFEQTLAVPFAGCASDLTEENIQSRCRGVILMALSNKSGAMVLATGNKSEMAVGYATLYGDMCGGYAPLKDVYKTEVYRLARWRNAHKPEGALGPEGTIIPERVLTKAPTAELRPNQTDQDSLPPYATLDAILQSLIEHDKGLAAAVDEGHDAATVRRVWAMLDRSEYKRRQAPPGPKVTRRHLRQDRRYPITNRYREN